MDAGLAVLDFLEYVVRGLVAQTDEARIEHREADGLHCYRILLPPGETGRVVGKGGKTIGAIRNLVAASAEKHGIRAEVEVGEL